MRRQFALRTEILAGFDQPFAEQHLPEAIDGDARCQRMFPADQPLRKTEAVVWIAFRHRRQRRRDAALYFFDWRVVSASFSPERMARLRHLLHHHQGRKIVLESLS